MISNSSINLKRLGLLLASLSLPALLYGCNALQSPFGAGLDLAVQTDIAEESVTQSADASSPVITIITYNEITMLRDPRGFIDFDSQLATAAETSMVAVVFKPQALYRDEPAGPDLSFKMAQTSASFEALRQAAITELEKQSDAWYRLQQGMSLHSVDNKRVAVQLKWYLDHRGYLERVMQRAEPILPFILDELERKNLPAELALLPVVESAYQAFAYSHGRASGLWQIIPPTGRFLGLKQNWWYDGRRDMIESTRAAIRYLDSLAKQFDGDWELALASYNAGPGRIRSAVRYNKRKNRPTDFWHLTSIRRETRDYVPKLFALKELFGNPDKYQFELRPISNEPLYKIVELNEQIDLALAADLAGITTNELYQLNPAFNRWATAPNGPHRLLIPRDKTTQFKLALQQLPTEKRVNWVRHKIKPGDTLSQISRQYRTSSALIIKVNKIRGTRIRAGKYLMIPTATKSLNSYKLSQSARISSIQNTPRSGTRHEHIVRSGQSLWSISRNYNVSTSALAKWNGIAPIDTLSIGQKLIVWSNQTAELQRASLTDISPRQNLYALRYTIRKGDSLSRIANRFNIRVSDIKRWNTIGKYLQPGQKIKLYIDVSRQSG
ncbi:MAG: LysM peptidoglycan-binding domain-containing protein [Gammaproteobacteria bacterium]|nr:LysM peptidoglycan-binding domain-containing protein [Gammaproteobacteria bacterium]